MFLFALLAGAANFWRALGIASMSTLAHSISLSLTVLGLAHAPAAVVEPLIALSIIWVAVENMLDAGRLWRRFAVTFVFGLVHGLGFAAALAPLTLAGWTLVRPPSPQREPIGWSSASALNSDVRGRPTSAGQTPT